MTCSTAASVSLHVEPVDRAAEDLGARGSCRPPRSAVRAPTGTRRCTASAARSAAWPSHSGIGAGRRRRPARARSVEQARGIVAEQDVRAVADRHRPLGVGAQREAADAERGGLLLHAARVGHDRAGAGLEREEVEVADRVGAADARRLEPLELRRAARAARGCAGAPGRRSAPAPASAQSASTIPASRAGSSTFDGRCSVTSRYSPSSTPWRAPDARARAPACSKRRSESIIVLPT